MLKKIGIGLAVVLVGLAVAIATRPDTFRVERSAMVAAPADVAFAYVNDFHRWNQWSPFEKLDPAMQRSFSGSPAGVGAVYGWSGNSKAGSGTMAITQSAPNQRVTMDLRFEKPFKASNVAEFTFTPTPRGTRVTWSMSGRNNVMSKAISLFASMDQLVGKQFEEGLANLDAVSRAEAAQRAQPAPAS